MTVSGDTHGILGMAGEYGLRDRKWFHPKTRFSIVTCTNLRGSDATLKVSQRFLGGQEVVVLVFEVIQLQVATSVHPQQLVACGQDGRKQSDTTRIKRPIRRQPPRTRQDGRLLRPSPGCCQATASSVSMRRVLMVESEGGWLEGRNEGVKNRRQDQLWKQKDNKHTGTDWLWSGPPQEDNPGHV